MRLTHDRRPPSAHRQHLEVEVLDVTEDEARLLLLSIDPLAALAQTQAALLERLQEITPNDAAELQAAWDVAHAAGRRALDEGPPAPRRRPKVSS